MFAETWRCVFLQKILLMAVAKLSEKIFLVKYKPAFLANTEVSKLALLSVLMLQGSCSSALKAVLLIFCLLFFFLYFFEVS